MILASSCSSLRLYTNFGKCRYISGVLFRASALMLEIGFHFLLKMVPVQCGWHTIAHSSGVLLALRHHVSVHLLPLRIHHYCIYPEIEIIQFFEFKKKKKKANSGRTTTNMLLTSYDFPRSPVEAPQALVASSSGTTMATGDVSRELPYT